ncbi:MAG: GTPase [Candidatus Hodarchaeales archaeon]
MNFIHLIPISGRPNAGKTSLVNYLCHSKRPVGKHAGTTLRIEFIPLVQNLHLVDLPGFGRIIKHSKKFESKMKDEIIEFFDDPSHKFLFPLHVIDISTFHYVVENLEKKGIIPIDIEMIEFIAEKTNFPPVIVFNKLDKVKPTLVKQNITLLQSYDLPKIEIFLLSLKTKKGCRDLRNHIKNLAIKEFGSKYQHW